MIVPMEVWDLHRTLRTLLRLKPQTSHLDTLEILTIFVTNVCFANLEHLVKITCCVEMLAWKHNNWILVQIDLAEFNRSHQFFPSTTAYLAKATWGTNFATYRRTSMPTFKKFRTTLITGKCITWCSAWHCTISHVNTFPIARLYAWNAVSPTLSGTLWMNASQLALFCALKLIGIIRASHLYGVIASF